MSTSRDRINQNNNESDSVDTVTNLMDATALTQEEEDALLEGGNIETGKVREAFKLKECLHSKTKNFLKAKTVSQKETRPERAPIPLCFGPPKLPKRGKRGARKNTKNPTENLTNPQTMTEKGKVKDADVAVKPTINDPDVNKDIKPTTSEGVNSNKQNTTVENCRDNDEEKVNAVNSNQRKVSDATNENEKSKHESKKRPRSAGTTPTGKNKKVRTFADVVSDDLKVMITDKDREMDVDQVMKLEEAMMKSLDDFLASRPSRCPTFHDYKFNKGSLRLICADLFAKQWLETTIASMTPLWDNACLEVVQIPPFDRRPTIRFFIPDGLKKMDFKTIVQKLSLQNPPLRTSNWTAWKQDQKDDGVFYHVSVDENVITHIENRGCRLFYYFSKIKVITPKKATEEEGDAGVVANGEKTEG